MMIAVLEFGARELWKKKVLVEDKNAGNPKKSREPKLIDESFFPLKRENRFDWFSPNRLILIIVKETGKLPMSHSRENPREIL